MQSFSTYENGLRMLVHVEVVYTRVTMLNPYSNIATLIRKPVTRFVKKWSFPLRISSVNVTKSAVSAVSCGFGHIY